MQNRKKAPEGFYTASDAMAVIGIPNSSFYNLVRDGSLGKVMFPGRKEAVYSKIDIDNYARSMKAFSMAHHSEKMDFGLALTEDIHSIRELVASVSGGYAHAVPEDILKAWIRRNPQSVHILRIGTEIVGYISMFPLVETTLIDRLSGRKLNRTIPVDDIQQFTPNKLISLYIAEMAVKHSPEYIKNDEPDPDKADPHARLLGARLIKYAARFILDLRKQGTVVNELYSVGTTQFGIGMSRDLGMEPMDLPEGVREDRVPFRLDIRETPKSILVRELRKSLVV